MDPALTAFITDLDNAASWDVAWRRTLDHFAGFGMEWGSYGYCGTDASMPFADFLASSLPEDWQSYFDAVGGIRHDPTARHVTTELAPTLTGPDFIDRHTHGEQAWRCYEVLRSFGPRSGFAVPLRYRVTGGTGIMLMGSRLPRKAFVRLYRERAHVFHLAVLCADAKLIDIEIRAQARAVGLTARERECLLWLSQGLRNDRIAERLGLSNATVEMHLASARRKLAAATREQALAKAVMLGLVEP